MSRDASTSSAATHRGNPDGCITRQELVERQSCSACGAPIPLENITDRQFRLRHRQPRRVVTHHCPACERTYTASFEAGPAGWQLLGRVRVMTKAETLALLDRAKRRNDREGKR